MSEQPKGRIAVIRGLVEQVGLRVTGHRTLESGESIEDLPCGRPAKMMVMVGNTGSDMWRVFEKSPEYADGDADPLDRWTRRIGDSIASTLNCAVVYPFDGPPYAPFINWAREASPTFTSPLMMLIHPRDGLWHAYRFALLLAQGQASPAVHESAASPCESCVDQPCLDACPVNAFQPGEYALFTCVDFLAANPESACRQTGCAARRACPIGRENMYAPEHARFHMDAFVRSQAQN